MPLSETDDRDRGESPADGCGRERACTIEIRRVSGPEAVELHLLCRPEPGTNDPAEQARALYRAVLDRLAREGASFEQVASETLFASDVRSRLAGVLEARRRVLEEDGCTSSPSPTAVIGQPPLALGANLEVQLLAVLPRHRLSLGASEAGATATDVRGVPACPCEACEGLRARLVHVGAEVHAHAGNIYGAGEGAFEQTYAMFCAGEALLREAGMSFRDVVRTWIALRDMDRDYAEFNRGRSAFFRSRGIELMPASTAVGGEPAAAAHDVTMRLYAVKSPEPLQVRIMSAPTLNEAWMYGSDFSRGIEMCDANKKTLFVSGTASVDEQGRTVATGDFRAQAERMLVNIASLLEEHQAGFEHLVSAVAFVKDAADAPALRSIFRERGFEGFPCTFVEAPICRPDLLCETEAVAVLPLRAPESQADRLP